MSRGPATRVTTVPPRTNPTDRDHVALGDGHAGGGVRAVRGSGRGERLSISEALKERLRSYLERRRIVRALDEALVLP